MGLERLSLLIMDDVIAADRRAADDAWREMHRRPDVLLLPASAGPARDGLLAGLGDRAGSLGRRWTRRAAPVTPTGAAPVPGKG